MAFLKRGPFRWYIIYFVLASVFTSVDSIKTIFHKPNKTFILLGELKKCPAFETIVLPENHSNDNENCLVLFPAPPIRFNNLYGFNRPSLPVEMGDFLQRVPFENLQKRSENTKQDFLLFSFLALMTLGCVYVFCLLGRMEFP